MWCAYSSQTATLGTEQLRTERALICGESGHFRDEHKHNKTLVLVEVPFGLLMGVERGKFCAGPSGQELCRSAKIDIANWHIESVLAL